VQHEHDRALCAMDVNDLQLLRSKHTTKPSATLLRGRAESENFEPSSDGT